MAAHLTAGVPQRISEAFEVAARGAGGVVERCYRIAGYPVTIRAAGSTVSDWLDTTFHHLRTEPYRAPPKLDGARLGRWAAGSFPSSRRANMTAAWRARFVVRRFGRQVGGEGTGQWPTDERSHRPPSLAVYWMAGSRTGWPEFERGTPLLTALQRWLAAPGV